MKRLFYLFIVLLFNTFSLSAFHIVGGDFTYKHISGNTFEMKLVLFRDCFSAGAPFDPFITVGFFEQVTNDSIQAHNVSLTSSGPVVPSGLDCATPPNVCVEEGIYTWQVTLPNNPNGYYAVWERCCRNITVTNLLAPDNTGLVFYLEMPDPVLQNSSPEFIDPPLPYVCESNPFEYSFTAVDADGDLIVYSLQTPLAGNTGQVGNMPILPAPLPAPYDSAIWAPGFNLANISGGVPIAIHPQTGLITGTTNLMGMFAMAVSVKEYRNGIQIGEVRREIEFVVLLCEQNNAPDVTDTLSFFLNHIELFPTDSLCFTITVNDQDGDSISVTHSGSIFSHSNPAVAQDVSGTGSVTTYFCWLPTCGDVSSSNYEATFTVKDDGCPLPKTTVHTYTISVADPPVIPPANLLCLEYIGTNGLNVHFNDTLGKLSKYFNKYNIYRSVDGGPFTFYGTENDSAAVNWLDVTAPQNDVIDYCYYIRGVNICGDEGLPSDTICSLSNTNSTVNYLNYVSVDEENKIELKWEPNYDYLFSEFYVERKINDPISAFSPFLSFSSPSFTSFIDNTALTDIQSYCYRILTKNVCGNFSQPSNEACSIFLSGESELFQHILNWTPYSTWQGGVSDYKIMRSVPGSVNYTEVGSALETEHVFTDKNLNLLEGEFVYKIKAVEGAGGREAVSYSNEIILEQQPYLYIPNAFTPNNDGANDTWGPGSAFVEEMELKIFNRFGQMVFYSDDVQDYWDGTFEGKKASEGVYVYRLTYSGFDSMKSFIKTGTIVLYR